MTTKHPVHSSPLLSTPVHKAKPLVVAGIPAFNEEHTIARLVLEAQKHVDVVLVCDDGSTDLTAEIAERMGADVIRHKRNLGYGAATKSLFEVARELNADVLVTLDGDGQHNPSEIPGLVKPVLEDGADVVLGSRFLTSKENGVPRYRCWGIRLISRLTGVASKQKLKDAQCGFRVFGRKAIEELDLVENGMGASVELVMKAKQNGFCVVESPAEVKYDGVERSSTQNALGHGASVIMSILRMVIEERPLTMLGLPGLIFLLAGTSFGIWMLKLFVEEQRIVTNVALAAMSFILIGMFTLFTAITLYAVSRHTHKMNGNHNHGGN
jgi:glycosyltransferase involved in cell wall biosynthesis